MPGEDVDAESEWLEEAAGRRYQTYREGRLAARGSDEALLEARKKLA